PSELVVLALVVWAADLYARKEQLLKHPRHVWLPMLPVAAVVIALIVAQDDLGTALILFAIALGMLWIAGIPRRYMVGIGATVAAILGFFVAIAPHPVSRTLDFMDPRSAADTAGAHSVPWSMAVAPGRSLG